VLFQFYSFPPLPVLQEIEGSLRSVETFKYFLLSYFRLTATSWRLDAVTGSSDTFLAIISAHSTISDLVKPVYSSKIGGWKENSKICKKVYQVIADSIKNIIRGSCNALPYLANHRFCMRSCYQSYSPHLYQDY
jgi:hypothetical protein